MPKYNEGQIYEKKIREILKKNNLLPEDLYGNDAGFIHFGKDYFLEVKNKNAPDFGQKGLIWSQENGWAWRKIDVITDLYDEFGVRNLIDKEYIPRRYSKPKESLNEEDRSYDQQKFEQSGIILENNNYLYEYYAEEECYYIQVEEKGFYYLKEDIANLNVPRFIPNLTLRLRAKTHHSSPAYKYSFFAVIRATHNTVNKSRYDIEEKVGKFPRITR